MTPGFMALASMRRTTRCTVRPTMVRAGRSPKKGGGLSSSGITMLAPTAKTGTSSTSATSCSAYIAPSHTKTSNGNSDRSSAMSWKWLSTLVTKNFSRSKEISLGSLEPGALGEPVVEVARGDLGGAAVGEVGHAEPVELAAVLRPGVPADVVPGRREVGRDAGEWVEVPVGRDGCAEDLHDGLSQSRYSLTIVRYRSCRCPPPRRSPGPSGPSRPDGGWSGRPMTSSVPTATSAPRSVPSPAQAGVAVPTVYYTFGTKAALLDESLGAAIGGFDRWPVPPTGAGRDHRAAAVARLVGGVRGGVDRPRPPSTSSSRTASGSCSGSGR